MEYAIILSASAFAALDLHGEASVQGPSHLIQGTISPLLSAFRNAMCPQLLEPHSHMAHKCVDWWRCNRQGCCSCVQAAPVLPYVALAFDLGLPIDVQNYVGRAEYECALFTFRYLMALSPEVDRTVNPKVCDGRGEGWVGGVACSLVAIISGRHHPKTRMRRACCTIGGFCGGLTHTATTDRE